MTGALFKELFEILPLNFHLERNTFGLLNEKLPFILIYRRSEASKASFCIAFC
jgi:hypothetical protein